MCNQSINLLIISYPSITSIFIKGKYLDAARHIPVNMKLVTCELKGAATDPPSALRRNQTCQHVDFRLLASRTLRLEISVV